MNILCATGIYPPEIGGPATFAAMIKKELPARNHNIRVVTYADTHVGEVGVASITRALPKGVRHAAYFFAIARNIFWADVIIALDPVSAGLPAMWVARLFHKKLVLRMVGDYAWEQGIQRYGVDVLLDDFLTRTWSAPVERLRRVEKNVAVHAAKIIVPSAYLASIVEQWGVPRQKISIVPNSVSLPPLPERVATRHALGFTDERVVISAGRLVPWKGFTVLIDAVKNLPVTLVIIGDGPDRDILKVRAVGQNNIRFTGVLPKEKLIEYLAAADIFALNTGYEGFSHQVIEAMAAGLAVVTTSAGGNKELVQDGENALVVPSDNEKALRDALLRLSADKALRLKLGEGARATASVYTKEKTLNALDSLLRSL